MSASEIREVDLEHPLVQDFILHPTKWRLWPAVAVLRWLERHSESRNFRIVYRTYPSLSFAPSEVRDIAISVGRIEFILNAPGFATAGSGLPSADIARIGADHRAGGAINTWLDSIVDVFLHCVEDMVRRGHAPFSLAMGEGLDSHRLAAQVSGATAPLSVTSEGMLTVHGTERDGAIGLAAAFFGTPSASGLEAVMRAYTGLGAHVEEFSGHRLPIASPLTIGGRLGAALIGDACNLPSAGVTVHIDAGASESAREWITSPMRRRSLHRLARAYVGATTPVTRIVVWLDTENIPQATLGSPATTLGALAVLGTAPRRDGFEIGE